MKYKLQNHRHKKPYTNLKLHDTSGKKVTLEELVDLFNDDMMILFCRYLPYNYQFFDDQPDRPENEKFETAVWILKEILKEVRLNPRKTRQW